MARAYKRYLAVAAATLAVLIVGQTAGFYLMFGTHTQSSANRCANAQLKQEIAQRMRSPKLAIIAGSSATRGINAEMVAQATGENAVNLGLFAAFGPDLLLHLANQTLRPGDRVLLALEYNSYVYRRPTGPAVDFVLGCGRDYFDSLPLADKAAYVFALDWKRAFESAWHRAGEVSRDRESMTAWADLRLRPQEFPPLSRTDRDRITLYRPMAIALDRTSHGARAIADFVRWAGENHITVMATWPNTIDFAAYRSDPGFEDIRQFYADLGVPMVGDPAISLFPAAMFYDTQYHLNQAGIRLRSEKLAAALAPILGRKQATDTTNVKPATLRDP